MYVQAAKWKPRCEIRRVLQAWPEHLERDETSTHVGVHVCSSSQQGAVSIPMFRTVSLSARAEEGREGQKEKQVNKQKQDT